MLREHSSQIADTLFFASASAAGTTWLADLDHFVSIVAALVAIAAGSVSIYMHITRRKRRRDESK